MANSLIKIKCVSPKIKLGDIGYNLDLIANEIKSASSEGVNVLLLPELSLCGYTLRDMLSSSVIVDGCMDAIPKIAFLTKNTGVLAYVGAPVNVDGRLYNCMLALGGGRVVGIIPKRSFEKKSPFGEIRVFDKPEKNNVSINALGFENISFGTDIVIGLPENDAKIGCVIGNSRENIVNLKEIGANVILNPTAEIVTVTMQENREALAKEISYNYGITLAMCNSSMEESTTDGLFAPHNVICQNGKILSSNPLFFDKTSGGVCEIDVMSKEKGEKPQPINQHNNSPFPFILDNKEEMDKRCELILNIQANALARRLTASYSKTMVVGISGGLDSTLALIAMVKAADILGWDRKNIIAITMPCFGTTKRTKSNATSLCEALGVTLKEIDILEATRIHLRDIGHDESIRNVTYENAQARERTQILMDVANDENGIVVGTGDLSEVALGWATYNGDHMAMYNVNSDIPKTLVRHVVGYFASCCEENVSKILFDILDTPVSPELLPAKENGEIEQKTEDLVGPYDLHDYFLYNFVGRGYAPSKIYSLAKDAFKGRFDEKTIYKWLKVFVKRFFAQQFKRSASPEGVKVGSVSLSPRGDFNMPSDMSFQAFLDELEQNK